MKYLWIGLGGALGAVARYVVGTWVYERLGPRFPFAAFAGTFLVNISGCFAIGLVIALLDSRSAMPPAWRYAVPIGFIGAYTTFSTFEYETFRAVQGGVPAMALLNVLLSVTVGYAAVWLGFAAGRHLA